MSRTVVIVGAGIGGLTTALALQARGIPAVVLEAAPELRPLGVGINIQPAAVGKLVDLGLGEHLAATGIATKEYRHVDHTGQTLLVEPRGHGAGHASPQYSLHRGELQMLLLAAVRDRLGQDAVRVGMRVTRVEQTPAGVRAVAGDERVEGAALVAADGLRSVVRSLLHPGEGALSAAGITMWRGLTDLPEFLDGWTMVLGNDEHGARLVAYPCSARARASGRALLNWVCLVPTGGSAQPPGWDTPAEAAEVLPHFADWDLGWLDLPRAIAQSTRILRYPMVDRDPLPSWGQGRVTLLGDAAHLMYPIGANGASQAILDAHVLAAELDRSPGDVAGAFKAYEQVRRPATTEIVLANRRMDQAERGIAGRSDRAKRAELAKITSAYRGSVER
jgi:2-polyprenyl-6-methoxyphenol hydroxylase-like FAD-dependent oxidoreductase